MSSVNRTTALLLLFFCGCARYEPLLLTQQVVHRELEPPPVAEIRVAADRIKHPILRPVEYDPSDGLSPDEFAVLGVLVNPGCVPSETGKSGGASASGTAAAESATGVDDGFSERGPTGGTVNANGLGVGWDITSLIGYSGRVDAASASPWPWHWMLRGRNGQWPKRQNGGVHARWVWKNKPRWPNNWTTGYRRTVKFARPSTTA